MGEYIEKINSGNSAVYERIRKIENVRGIIRTKGGLKVTPKYVYVLVGNRSLGEYLLQKNVMSYLIWGGIGAVVLGAVIVSLIMIVTKRKRTLRLALNCEKWPMVPKREAIGGGGDGLCAHRIKLTNRIDFIKTYQCDFSKTVVIGRNPSVCTLLIGGDNSLSGSHCEVYFCKDEFYIKDLNSSNGTKVNGIPLGGDFILHSGDIVKLGRNEYIVELQ